LPLRVTSAVCRENRDGLALIKLSCQWNHRSWYADHEARYFAAILQRFAAGVRGVQRPDRVALMPLCACEHSITAGQTRGYGLRACVRPAYGHEPSAA